MTHTTAIVCSDEVTDQSVEFGGEYFVDVDFDVTASGEIKITHIWMLTKGVPTEAPDQLWDEIHDALMSSEHFVIRALTRANQDAFKFDRMTFPEIERVLFDKVEAQAINAGAI